MTDGKFDYAELRDMLIVAWQDNDSIAYHKEIVKEIFEIRGFSWKELIESTNNEFDYLLYFAENPLTEIPEHPFWFDRNIRTNFPYLTKRVQEC